MTGESWDGESWLVTKGRVMFGPYMWSKEWNEKETNDTSKTV